MLKNSEFIFGIIASISILLYVSKYILHDLYPFLKNAKCKSKINKILPFLAKNNTFFISLALFFSSLHIYFNYSSKSIFDPGYLTLFLVVFLIIIKIFNRKFIDIKQYLTSVPYLLLVSLVVHICFR